MSKFFIETSPYHDNGELIKQLFDSAESAIDYAKSNVTTEGFNVWEIGETELIEYDRYIKPDEQPNFLSSDEYQVYDLNKSKKWHYERGFTESWNDHVLNNSLGEGYLIK